MCAKLIDVANLVSVLLVAGAPAAHVALALRYTLHAIGGVDTTTARVRARSGYLTAAGSAKGEGSAVTSIVQLQLDLLNLKEVQS